MLNLWLPDQRSIGEEPYRTARSPLAKDGSNPSVVIFILMVGNAFFRTGVLDRSVDVRHKFRCEGHLTGGSHYERILENSGRSNPFLVPCHC
jgi:hypothetical protein